MGTINKFRLLFALSFILILGLALRYYHYDRYPRHGATFDEFAWTWQGISLWQTGIPTSWSPHPHYHNFEIKKFQGAWIRFVTPYLEHPPLFGLIAGGFALLTGSDNMDDIELPQIRILALIMGVMSVLLVYLLAKRLYGQKVAWLAGLFYATVPTLVFGSRIVQNENFFIPCFLTLWLLLLKFLQTGKNRYRNLASFLAGLLTLAKVPWAAATIAGCLLLIKEKKTKDAFLFGLIALGIFLVYFLYGRYYDWSTFIGLWGLQTARNNIGLGNILALFTHPYLVDRIYADGWIYFGWLAIAILSLEFNKHYRLLIPLLAYFFVFILAIPGIEAQGWYRYPFYPFLIIASAVTFDKMTNKPNLLNFIWFCLISSSAFHWGWQEIFGLSNLAFRLILLLGGLTLLTPIFRPDKYPTLAKKATYFWLIVFVILNIFSVLSHVHS